MQKSVQTNNYLNIYVLIIYIIPIVKNSIGVRIVYAVLFLVYCLLYYFFFYFVVPLLIWSLEIFIGCDNSISHYISEFIIRYLVVLFKTNRVKLFCFADYFIIVVPSVIE